MRYKLSDGRVIIAEQVFIDAHFPGATLLPELPAPAIRKIRQDLFPRRFSLYEKARMRSSSDPIVQVFWDEATSIDRPYINLDDEIDLLPAMKYLRDNKHPTTQEYYLDGATPEARQARMQTILRDGTTDEAF